MIDVDSEDEVNTQKKKVTREASKKTPKEPKKKVTKKNTQKKGVQKKKGLTAKGNLKNPRQARKNVKVNRGTMCCCIGVKPVEIVHNQYLGSYFDRRRNYKVFSQNFFY